MSDLRNQFKAETGEEFKSKTSYKGGEFIVTGINTKYVIWLEEMLEKAQANGADKSTEPALHKHSVSGSNYCKQCKEPIPDGFRFCSGECKQYYYR